MTAGSCPPPGLSRALPVGVIGCGHAASQSMRCPLAYHLAPSSSSVVLGGFCAHSWGGSSSVRALRSKSRKMMMMPQGS